VKFHVLSFKTSSYLMAFAQRARKATGNFDLFVGMEQSNCHRMIFGKISYWYFY